MLVPMRIRHSNLAFDSVHPESFVALMDMYEQNYIRLRCLCPSIAGTEVQTKLISSLPGPAHDLHLTVIERARHTTTLQLTYVMADGSLRPDITVRVYHEALQAEVLNRACRVGGRIEIDRGVSETALICRWKLNRFLYKWLGYCLRQGHLFSQVKSDQDDLQGRLINSQKKPANIL